MKKDAKILSRAEDEKAVFTPDGGERRVLVYGGSLMLVQFKFPAGVTATWHQHPHEQVGIVISGEIDFCADDRQTTRLSAGGSYYVAGGVWHNIITRSDTVIVDTFTPLREDFLELR
jgi:quercetin dioxygenase-like cupin family protein